MIDTAVRNAGGRDQPAQAGDEPVLALGADVDADVVHGITTRRR